MIRRSVGCVLLTLAVLAVPSATHAAPITYGLAGVFSFSTEPLLPVGTTYSASLTFDPLTFVTSGDPFGGTRYSSGTFEFATALVALSGPVSITIDSADDWIRVDSVSLMGTFPAGVRLNLIGAGLTSDSFPDPFPTLADFDFAQIVINRTSSTTGSITTFQPVPEPASLGFVSLGAAALAAIRGRKRRSAFNPRLRT